MREGRPPQDEEQSPLCIALSPESISATWHEARDPHCNLGSGFGDDPRLDQRSRDSPEGCCTLLTWSVKTLVCISGNSADRKIKVFATSGQLIGRHAIEACTRRTPSRLTVQRGARSSGEIQLTRSSWAQDAHVARRTGKYFQSLYILVLRYHQISCTCQDTACATTVKIIQLLETRDGQ